MGVYRAVVEVWFNAVNDDEALDNITGGCEWINYDTPMPIQDVDVLELHNMSDDEPDED